MRSGLPGLAFLLAVLLARAGASESVLLLPLAGLSTAPDPLRAVLLRPQPTDNRPAAVMVHGFGGAMQIATYPGVHHDFDNPDMQLPRRRMDVPTGASPGTGVMAVPKQCYGKTSLKMSTRTNAA